MVLIAGSAWRNCHADPARAHPETQPGVASSREESVVKDELIDRLTQGVADRLDRRALAGLAGMGLATLLGLAPAADAKKKKKKKKKKAKPVSPPPADTGCTRSCAGKICGDDGCGGTCGTCGAGSTCNSGQCVANRGFVFVDK